MIHIPLYLKLLSYLQSVSLRRSASEVSGSIELLLYHNRFRLFTNSAFYSDGDHYFPALAVARHLREFLPAVRSVLVLGAGLGSLVHVMRARGCAPHYTLVEKDKTVLKWALEILGEGNPPKLAARGGSRTEPFGADSGRMQGTAKRRILEVFKRAATQQTAQNLPERRRGDFHRGLLEPVSDDAESFMAQNERKYDLVFVDIFKGRVVPDFVTSPLFLRQCRNSLAPGGRVALNYIEINKHKWDNVQKAIAGVFPGCQVISKDDNRILISSPSTTNACSHRSGATEG